jgi:septation ring formation regulator EzrA
MWILIISLIVLALVAAAAGILRNWRLQKKIDRGELDAMPEVREVVADNMKSANVTVCWLL